MIELRMIGCNGGIGGSGRQTTCYGIGERILIDAGTGLGTLSLEQLACIDHVVLTHAHLDHVACLPLMLDSAAAMRDTPLTAWASAEVIDVLRTHLFNDRLWPDFTQIPTAENPFLRFATMPDSGAEIGGVHFAPLPARHGIPACGYRVEAGGIAIAFSGDTADCDGFWNALADDARLRAVIAECSYPQAMTAMAELSMHMDSNALAARLRALPTHVAAIVVHRKPGLEEPIAAELAAALPGRDLRLPTPGTMYRIG